MCFPATSKTGALLVRDSLAITARWAAAQRARESERADRLFDDPWAAALAGEEGHAALRQSEIHIPRALETAAYIAIRTRVFDDFVTVALDRGLRQVVVLAAGLDSRAFRLDLPAGLAWWELDRAEVLSVKTEVLTREKAEPRCAWTPVAADLTGDWVPALLETGFRPEAPSLWLVEGLIYYLEEVDARRLVGEISRLAACRSAFGTDLVSASYFTSPWTAAARTAMAERGWTWRFGVDDPEAFLARFGWIATVRQPGDPGAAFGRWPTPVPPRLIRALPHGFLVTATKT